MSSARITSTGDTTQPQTFAQFHLELTKYRVDSVFCTGRVSGLAENPYTGEPLKVVINIEHCGYTAKAVPLAGRQTMESVLADTTAISQPSEPEIPFTLDKKAVEAFTQIYAPLKFEAAEGHETDAGYFESEEWTSLGQSVVQKATDTLIAHEGLWFTRDPAVEPSQFGEPKWTRKNNYFFPTRTEAFSSSPSVAWRTKVGPVECKTRVTIL